jgi:hypothetical protein
MSISNDDAAEIIERIKQRSKQRRRNWETDMDENLILLADAILSVEEQCEFQPKQTNAPITAPPVFFPL